MKKRYFIVFFSAYLKDRHKWYPFSNGIIGDSYPNRKAFIEATEGANFETVEITNITELSKEDFDSWIA